jgi:hypothetical protein
MGLNFGPDRSLHYTAGTRVLFIRVYDFRVDTTINGGKSDSDSFLLYFCLLFTTFRTQA